MGSRCFNLLLSLAGPAAGILALGACGLTFNPVHMPVVEATAQLKSPSVTAKAVARLDLNCGSATEYWLIESSQILALGKVPATYAPLATDAGWVTCPSGDFSANFTLPLTNNGVNTVHAFFKTGSDLYKHGETFAVRSLATSSNPYFALNDEPQEYEGFIDLDGCMMTCSGELIALENGYAIVRPGFSSTPLEANGKVTFFDRSMTKTFEYAGDEDWDMFGQNGVVPLRNGLVVVLSRWDSVNGIMGSGSAVFLDTKNPTSPFLFRIAGNEVNDQIGRSGAVELSSGLVAIRSASDNVGGNSRGSVIFVDPTKPASPEVFRINGDEDFDYLGQTSLVELSSGVVVIGTMSDHVGGTQRGSVIFVNPANPSSPELFRINGDHDSDSISSSGIIELSSGLVVVASSQEQVGATVAAGSVKFIDPTNVSSPLVFEITGSTVGDVLGTEVIELSSGLVAIRAPSFQISGTARGKAIFVNPATPSTPVVFEIAGNEANDSISSGGIFELSSGMVVVSSPSDSVGGTARGSVKFLNPSTPVTPEVFEITGTVDNSYLGAGNQVGKQGIVELTDGLVAITSYSDNTAGTARGSVRIVDPTRPSGQQLHVFHGAVDQDSLGYGGVQMTKSGYLSIASPYAFDTALENGLLQFVELDTFTIPMQFAGTDLGERLGMLNASTTKPNTVDISTRLIAINNFNYGSSFANYGRVSFIDPSQPSSPALFDVTGAQSGDKLGTENRAYAEFFLFGSGAIEVTGIAGAGQAYLLPSDYNQ